MNVPVYCNRLTREAIEAQLQIQIDARVFATGDSFAIGDVTVDTFPVPHDAYDPVGFLVRTAAGNIGFLTDLGHATKLVVERLRAANVVLLEANHDLKMLQDDPRRPWSLKQRILPAGTAIFPTTAPPTWRSKSSPPACAIFIWDI